MYLSNPDEFIPALKARLAQQLPGWEAHQIMAPPARRGITQADYEERKKTARLGSVLALLYPVDNVLHTVLMQRPTYEGTHSAQISFPGGKIEPFDTDRFEAALREAKEEVNVNRADVEVLGQLTEIYIPPSNFLVYPIVGYAAARPTFEPDAREVVEIIELPVKELLQDKNLVETSVVSNNIFRFNSPAFKFNERIVWGATAMMLAELKAILQELQS